MTTLMLFYFASGLLLMALAIPLIRGKMKPNGLYGFRIRKTLENPDIWYPANVYAGKGLFVVGLLTTAVSLLPLFIPTLTVDTFAILAAIIVLGVLFVVIGLSVRYVNRL